MDENIERRSDMPALALALRAVYIRNSSASIVGDFDPQIPGQALASQFRMEPGKSNRFSEYTTGENQVSRFLTFFTEFEFYYSKNLDIPADDYVIPEADRCAIIKAEIAVDYVYTGDKPPSDDQIKHWSHSSVLTQAWPYWREYCHSAMLRMALPVTMVPMLMIRQGDMADVEPKKP